MSVSADIQLSEGSCTQGGMPVAVVQASPENYKDTHGQKRPFLSITSTSLAAINILSGKDTTLLFDSTSGGHGRQVDQES